MRGETPTTALREGGAMEPSFAGQLQNQVAAHGIANQRKAANEVRAGQFAHHNSDVLGAPRGIDRGRKFFAVTTTAHIDADECGVPIAQLDTIPEHNHTTGDRLSVVRD